MSKFKLSLLPLLAALFILSWPASAHTHTYKVARHVAATCGKMGHNTLKCTSCGDTKVVVLPKASTGHKWKLARKKAATAKKNGYRQYKCRVCGKMKKDIVYYKKNDSVKGLASRAVKTYSIAVRGKGIREVTGRYDLSLPGKLVKLVNKARKKKGLPGLRISRDLTKAAIVRARELSYDYSPERPDGSGPVNRFVHGEAYCRDAGSASGALIKLMSDRMSCACLTYNVFKDVGIAAFARRQVERGDIAYKYYIAVELGARLADPGTA